MPCKFVSGKNPAASLIQIPCRSTVLILWNHRNHLIDIIDLHKIYLNVFFPMHYDKIKRLFQETVEVSSNVPSKSYSFICFVLFLQNSVYCVLTFEIDLCCLLSTWTYSSLLFSCFNTLNKFHQLPLLNSLLKFLLLKELAFLSNASYVFSDNLF